MDSQHRPVIGMQVIDNIGQLAGIVESVEHDHFMVEGGFFFPDSHLIPDSAIDHIVNNEIILRISRDTAQSSSVDHNWANDPEHGEIVPDTGDIPRSPNRGAVDPHKA